MYAYCTEMVVKNRNKKEQNRSEITKYVLYTFFIFIPPK